MRSQTMYLYSRRTRLTTFDGVDWANRIKDRVIEVSGNECQLWATMYGAGYGTLSWTSWFPDLAALQASGDALIADDGYLALSAEGANLTTGGVDDLLLKPLYGEVDPERPITYVTGVVATCAAGNIERAMTKGVEIAQKAESVTGLPTMFLSNVTGPYGGISWLTGYEDIAAMEKAETALNSDPAFVT
ncbi:MAG: hypothetical protein ACXWCB_17455, partial [Acidimicrobiales bacterium]